MQLDANDLILFARLIEAGSFSRAAERTGLPKSTLSRRLGQLETALGERLVVRSTRGLAITDFGERMLGHAQRLAEEAEAAADLAAHRLAAPRGVLRVSMAPDMAELDMAQLCLAYSARYPEVRLQLDLSPRKVDLVGEQFDIALRGAERLPDDGTLVARKLASFEHALYAAPAYLERHGAPQHPDELARHACLPLMASNGDALPWRLSRGAERWEGVPQGPLSANSPRLLREFALQGAGIAALGDTHARAALAQGLLRPVLPEWRLPAAAIWCLTPGRRLLPARTTAFIAMLQASLSQMG